jgi:ferredoxin
MGGGSHTMDSIRERVDLAEEDFQRILESLLYKGPVAIIRNSQGEKVYHVMTIYPGWFEFFMMRGTRDEEHREFARRIEKMYTAAYEFGNEDVINELISDVGPHLAVTLTSAPETKKIAINKKLEHENHVYAAPSVTAIFENLNDTEFISVGHCLCRFEKELIEDHCRVGMPMETCISIGPAAEHLIEQGISRQISKSEAIAMVKEWQDRGCIHQTGRTIPLKDFTSQYPVDIICNCCWDCCGVIGNYNRGYLPLTVTSYYRAIIAHEEECTGCGLCVSFCPVGIISISEDSVAQINENLCIGCGQCIHHCAEGAVALVPDKRVVFLPMLGRENARIAPPADLLEEKEDISVLDAVPSMPETEILAVLDEVREKMTKPHIQKVFASWNKIMQYHFTDSGESFFISITGGVPGPVTRGIAENAEIIYWVSGPVFVGLMKGTIDGFKAFRKKMVKVKAPVRDLVKLQKLIG